jgi:hypothetical protein
VTLPLTPGAATSIGSLPGDDPRAAARLVLAAHPLLPAAPQLPHRSPAEQMLAQWATGIEGVTVAPADGTIAVDPRRLDPEAPVGTDLTRRQAGGLHAFLAATASRRSPIKLQLTGPVTLGLALIHAGAPPARAFAVAGRAIPAKARALTALARAAAPDAPLVVFLDEPGLTAAGHPGFLLDAGGVTDLLSSSLAALAPAMAGVHCCGSTDWQLVMEAGARILSMPADLAAADEATAIAAHLEAGGWVAWGAVPTTGPLGADPDPLWRRLVALWCDLTRFGCDPALLRRQALVTPVCGLANHGPSQAALVLGLTAQLAQRVQDQAVAARLSVGA